MLTHQPSMCPFYHWLGTLHSQLCLQDADTNKLPITVYRQMPYLIMLRKLILDPHPESHLHIIFSLQRVASCPPRLSGFVNIHHSSRELYCRQTDRQTDRQRQTDRHTHTLSDHDTCSASIQRHASNYVSQKFDIVDLQLTVYPHNWSPSAAGRVQNRRVRRSKTDVLPLCHATYASVNKCCALHMLFTPYNTAQNSSLNHHASF